MNELKDRYVKVLIPEKTYFFRKALNTQIYETMFFSFDTYVTGAINYLDKPTQIWITRKPIISSFILKEKTKNNFYITDLEYCYERFCGEKMHYLDIKCIENPNRKAFLEFLKQNNIDSWVTSVENKSENEFHVFSNKNEEIISFKEYLTPKNEEYYDDINSFKNLKPNQISTTTKTTQFHRLLG
jgi:hypothetical protein